MTPVIPPTGFKISKQIRDELPPHERVHAAEALWEKSGGVCALCAEPLPSDGKNVESDHILARVEGGGGATELKNLYLAHRACNRSRQNLPFDLARGIVSFAKWCTAHPRRSFDEVVERYVPDGNQRARIISLTSDNVELQFGTVRKKASVSLDPATDTPYFFMDVPVAYIQNDKASQPRYIEHDHVRKLTVDFSVHPVHEPSNCRMVRAGGDLADLLQFDGQHKTTAQLAPIVHGVR